MPENFNIKISYNSDSKSPNRLSEKEKHQRKTVNLRPESLESIYAWIDSHVEETEIADELKIRAAHFPHNALAQFKKNFRNYLESIIMAKRRQAYSSKQEQKDDVTTESEHVSEEL